MGLKFKIFMDIRSHSFLLENRQKLLKPTKTGTEFDRNFSVKTSTETTLFPKIIPDNNKRQFKV